MTVATTALGSDETLVGALRQGDERAFEALVARHGPSMQRLARTFCGSDAVAQEVVQETWMAVITAIHSFEGRSSLSTWLLRILVNRAKTRGIRERRTVPMSTFDDGEDDGGSVAAERFLGDDAPWPGHWSAPPRAWEKPCERLLSLEARERLSAAIKELPELQRLTVALRDVEGRETEEVAAMLDVTPGHVRVLLHRGRGRLRQALEDYVDADV